MAVGESNNDKTYNDYQMTLYNSYDIKFKIKLKYDENKLKTASHFPSKWTDFTENTCKKVEKQIAFLTGEKNNLTVIDLDTYNSNKAKDKKYEGMKKDEYGVGLFKKLMNIDEFDELDDCVVVLTPSGGYHIYTTYLKELLNTNDLLPKIDIRNDGGCVFFTTDHQIIHYSKHISNKTSHSFLKAIHSFKSTKQSVENQIREITLETEISSIEDEAEYIEIHTDTDLIYALLSKLKKERFEQYDSWIRIGLILFNELGRDGFELWHSFSSKALNYKSEEDCRYHWNTFKKKEKRLSIRTLFYYLKDDNKKAFNEFSSDYYRDIQFENVEIKINKNAYYMDYLKKKEWKLNNELFVYLKERICYYEKAENTWFIRDYDEVNEKFNYKSVKDSHLYNTNIYVDTGIEKRKSLKNLIDICLKKYLTVSHIDFIPFSSVHRAPSTIFNLYVDNNEKYYQPELQINSSFIDQFLFHIKEIISANDEDVFKYIISWIAHKIQRPDKKIETCLLLMSPEQGTGKSIFTEILNVLTGDYLISTSIDKLSGQFNALYTRRTVIVLEELKKGLSNDTCDFLKDYITKEFHEENEKNKTMLRVKNVSDIIICSNNEETIKVNEFDRRYLITKLNPQMRGNHEYFDNLKKYKDASTDQFVHLYNFLIRYDISRFNPRNIPMTEIKQEMVDEMEDSVKSFVRYVNESIESERILCWAGYENGRVGRNDLYQKYREFCSNCGINTKYIDTQNRFGRKIKKHYEMRKSQGLEYYKVGGGL